MKITKVEHSSDPETFGPTIKFEGELTLEMVVTGFGPIESEKHLAMIGRMLVEQIKEKLQLV